MAEDERVETPLEPTHAWLREQGWSLREYSISKSAVQSCPQGMLMLDCAYEVEGASAEERASRSRVLEVDAESGKIEAVLAARDGEQLERILNSGSDVELAMPPATSAPVPSGEENASSQPPEEDPEVWDKYRAGKEELAETLRREGVGYFRSGTTEGQSRVGLLNQGATCYMNSLLQTLYMTQEFREYIFRWRYAAERDGPEDQCIAFQLQALFARLACSRCAAVSTKALTRSFGWNAAESFQQHDVQELNRVLFDALGRSSPAFATVASQFTGKVNDYIQDVRWPAEGCVRRCHEEEFMDIQVEVGPQVATVEDALQRYVTPEIMDGDNKWQVSDSGEKVEAKKGLSFVSFPKVLTLHLKRFVFDYATNRRKKVNDPLQISSNLDLRPFLAEEAEAAAAQDVMNYELYGILIHAGSAMGGHYHAYIKDTVNPDTQSPDDDASFGWFDYNDSQVTPLDLAALERMMCGTATAPSTKDAEAGESPEAGESADHAQSKETTDAAVESQPWAGGSAANAYMLVYRRRCPVASNAQPRGRMVELLPPEVQSQIALEGERYSRLKELYEFQQELVELRLCTTDGRSWQVELHQDSTLRAAVQVARSSMPTSTALEQAKHDAACDPYTEAGGGVEWRLRHFSPMTGRAGQTFAANLLDSRLADIGLAPTGIGGRAFDMMLEVRHETAPPFTEYNPNEMMIHVQVWDREKAQPADTMLSIVVPGEQLATVGDLRAAVAIAFDLSDESSKFWLVCPTAGSSKLDVLVLGDQYDNVGSSNATEESELEQVRGTNSMQQLRRDHKVWSGEKFYLDIHRGGGETAKVSTCAKHYEQQAYCVTIAFNSLEIPEEFDHTLAVDLRSSLLEVKAQIAELLGLDIDSFHLRRGQRSPMIKTENSTLQDLGLSEGSPLFVAPGRVLKDGEYVLKVLLLHAGVLTFLAEIPAAADKPTSVLKEDVAAAVGSSALPAVIAARESLGWQPVASRVRLRDCKGTEVGKVLQERKKLKSAISRLADGREIAVQLLSADENVGESDVILGVRRWHVCDRKIDPVVDLIISKHSTFAQLRDTIATMADLDGFMPEPEPEREPEQETEQETELDQEIDSLAEPRTAAEIEPECEPEPELKAPRLRRLGLAKTSAFGPPLDHRAAIKLRWNQSYSDEAMISTHPVSLRDGSLLVYCDEEDRAAAKAKAEAAKKAKGDAGTSGAAKRKGRGRGTRGRLQPFGPAQVGGSRAKAPAERGLQIHTRFDGEPADQTPAAEPQNDAEGQAAQS